jgi:hypothetical protein
VHDALILIARAVALAPDQWRSSIGRLRSLSGKIAGIEEQVQRLGAENELLRARWLRVPAKRRPHYRSVKAIETRLQRLQTWFNAEREHQGLGRRTSDDVYFDRPVIPTRNITGGTLRVRFHDGDRRLPILRLKDAA